MKRKFKTKEEFIKSVIQGDVWELDNYKYYYDSSSKETPFRLDNTALAGGFWRNVTTEEFTLVEPEPVYEERWQMMKDVDYNFTNCTQHYYNQKRIDEEYPEYERWYKGQSIKVKVNK